MEDYKREENHEPIHWPDEHEFDFLIILIPLLLCMACLFGH